MVSALLTWDTSSGVGLRLRVGVRLGLPSLKFIDAVGLMVSGRLTWVLILYLMTVLMMSEARAFLSMVKSEEAITLLGSTGLIDSGL